MSPGSPQKETAPSGTLDHEPLLFVPCLLCGSTDFRMICARAELSEQQSYLARFHARRLRPHLDVEHERSSLADRADFTQDYDTRIVACASCGLLCRNPRPKAIAITRAYASDTYEEAHLLEEFYLQLVWARRKIAAAAPRVTASTVPNVVEVGSFVGGFLAAAQEQGWRALGVDPGEAVARFCRSRQLPVHRGTLPQAPLEPRSVDAVFVWNTFDQLPDPRPTLEAAERCLKRGGLLVIRVPHGTCFKSAMDLVRRHRLFRAAIYPLLAWNNLLTFPYLYGYTIDSLDRLAAPYGFRREAVEADTLMPAAGRDSRWWASVEEHMVKWMCGLSARLESVLRNRVPRTACWLDVYYRKTL